VHESPEIGRPRRRPKVRDYQRPHATGLLHEVDLRPKNVA
jgi:hypothetical protein